MTKELFVSNTPHETKVGIVEDDQLAEVYFERENEYTLAGSIYKGRVTRVLPGMQSAFVDIGLERDAFLYVSDFFELQDEEGEFQEITVPRQAFEAQPSAEAAVESPLEPVPGPEGQPQSSEGASEAQPHGDNEQGGRGWRNRRRRRGRRGRGMPESKFSRGPETQSPAAPEPGREVRQEREAREEREPRATREPEYEPIILPGESISKYQNRGRTLQPEARAGVSDTGEPSAFSPREEPHTEPEEPAQERHESEPREERHYEQMNVAAVFGGGAAEREAEEQHREAERRLAQEEAAAQESHREERSFERDEPEMRAAASVHALEEEEIEDEESDMPSFAEELEDTDFEELEEETHEAREHEAEDGHNHIGNGVELTEAVEETDAERAAFAEEFAEENGQHHDDAEPAETSETEMLAEDQPHEADMEARAEVRAPAGTAGYQQRAQRPAWGDRRGRRMGRRFRRREPQRALPAITDLLKEGQEILVQIAKEPIGKKGARITSHIALPGRFLVYMPTVNHIGVSRKIASEEERQRLKRIVLSERENGHGGFIVRTAAAAADEDELRADIRFLKNLWNEIKHRAENSKSPALIYHDLNLVERILRDQVTQDFSQIWVDNDQEYERIVRFVGRFQPALAKRVKLYTKATPLFEQFNLQDEINKALKSKVWLKSGGYIVINQTEALVAIDINTGKYVGKTARLEDTIVKTNVDAIKEIVRQIRLRDLGGIIVIDFIDMDERRNRQKVMQALEEALRSDRAPSKVLQFNDFGLVAITRKRVKQSMERTLGSPCPYCSGTGFVKSVTTVCNEIYIEMRKIAKQLERPDVMLRVNPEVGKALKAGNARWLTELEELTGRSVIVKTDPTLHQEQFDID
ncbi:MAG TPA: Rne/Rng family ribonuclease [Terriglobales bacterium]|nr:Rne/Rng family ribonuclease [Terriglobales bacterium]